LEINLHKEKIGDLGVRYKWGSIVYFLVRITSRTPVFTLLENFESSSCDGGGTSGALPLRTL